MTKCLDFFKITYVLQLNIAHFCEKFGKDRPILRTLWRFSLSRDVQYKYYSDRPR